MDRAGIKSLGCAVVATALLIAAATASGAVAPNKPITLLPDLVAELDSSIQPTALSKNQPTPIALTFSGKVSNPDESRPSALRELAIELDKNIAINLNGYPTCHNLFQQVDPPMTPQEECRGASIGEGTARFEIRFPESEAIQVRSGMQIFNAGLKNGIPILVALAYIAVPVPSLVVTTIRIKKIHDNRYGTKMTFTFPRIAGEGAITSLGLRIKKQLPFDGRRFSPVTAKCADGKLRFHDTATTVNFETSETTKASGSLTRTCTGR